MGHVSWTEACNLLLAVRCCLKSSCGEKDVNFSLSLITTVHKPDIRVPICESANSGPPHARETRRCTPQLLLPSLGSHSKHPAYVYVFVYVHAYMYVYVYVCVCVCARAYVHVHTYRTHTRTRVYIHACVSDTPSFHPSHSFFSSSHPEDPLLTSTVPLQ